MHLVRLLLTASAALGATSVLAQGEAETEVQATPPAPAVVESVPEVQSRQLFFLMPELADAAQADQAVEALESQLRGLLVALEIERVAGSPESLEEAFEAHARVLTTRPGTLLVFWIAPGAGDRVRFHTAAEVGAMSFDRKFGDIVDRVRSEVFALIVRASVQALLEGRAMRPESREGAPEPAAQPASEPGPASEPEPVPEPKPEPEPVPAPKPEPVLDEVAPAGEAEAVAVGTGPDTHKWIGLEAAYAFDLYSSDQPANHGLHLGLTLHVTTEWLLLMDYRVMQAIEAGTAGASARLHRHPLALGVAYRWRFDDLAISAALYLTMDFQTHETRVMGPLLAFEPGEVKLAAMFTPRVRLAYRLYGPLLLFAEVGLEVSLKRIRWSVQAAGRNEVLFDPWPVHPRALAGVSVEIW